jgi:hypothetical protein
VPLDEVIACTGKLTEGGTLGVLLGQHALERGYAATLFTYNLRLFDPTWFARADIDLCERLRKRLEFKDGKKLRAAGEAYLKFLELGGTVRFEDLTVDLIRGFLSRSRPILTGLSSTFLYRNPREYGPKYDSDDIRGEPVGHFVVLCGYDESRKRVQIADPLLPNPFSKSQYYDVEIERLIGAILLGVLTYDANLLILEPR